MTLALLAMAAMAGAAASPSDLQPPAVVGARDLVAAGEFGEATALLRQRIAADPRDIEAYFLLGMIAVRQKSYTSAARYFRQALAISPGQVRVRLELARVLFLEGNYRTALRHFQLAETGKLPAPVRANVDRFLAAIRNAKDWSYNFDIALAPDSNINGATSARQALIFGLPFTLGSDARRASGVGLATSGNIEFAPMLGKHLRWRTGVSMNRRDYRVSRFNDVYYGAYAGPRFQTRQIDISILGTADVRDYAKRLYQRSVGGRVETAYYASPTSVVELTVNVEGLRFPTLPAQNGTLFAADFGVIKALTAVASISLDVGVARQSASASYYSSRGLLLGLGYRRELGGGFGLTVGPALSYVRYDSADPLLGKERADFTKEVSLSLTNQKFAIWQFTPRVTYRYSRRSSTSSLYAYSQHRLEFGLTTDF